MARAKAEHVLAVDIDCGELLRLIPHLEQAVRDELLSENEVITLLVEELMATAKVSVAWRP